MDEARARGAVVRDGRVVPHPDGQGGALHETGFTAPAFNDTPQGTTIPYRDDHGRSHEIPVQAMRRVTDASGRASYKFDLKGKTVSVDEGKAPLFQIDEATGKRFTLAADGTRQELGYDRNAAAKAGISPREAAARQAWEQKQAQRDAMSRQLTEKEGEITTVQAHVATVQGKLRELEQARAEDHPGGPAAGEAWLQRQRQLAGQELAAAQRVQGLLTQQVQGLQQQRAQHDTAVIDEHRRRQIEIGQHRSAAVDSPEDAEWQKNARSVQEDFRTADLNLIAEMEKTDPARAAAMRHAMVPAPSGRLFAGAANAFPPGAGGGGETAGAPGQEKSLMDVLMQAPVMTQGKGERLRTVDQTAAARATAQQTLGITDPENVRMTPGADGTYQLSRPGADGSGAAQPYATLDARNNRITLTPGPDGQYSQAALDLAAKGSRHGTPIYLPGGQPPYSEAEVSGLISKGLHATGATADRAQADAALTQAGLAPEDIGRLVQEGRLSVQDGKFLNDKFNSGVNSYADRRAGEAAQKQEAGLQQMLVDSKGTKEQPNFESWTAKGDPQRDAQVQAKAKELGVSEAEVRRDLETRRIMDWSTPLTQQSHDQQSGIGHGLARKMGFIGLAEPTRMLPDGGILPNPELGGDSAKFDAAIDGSLGTDEAKAKAKGLWGQYHDNYLTNVRASLETMETLPGVENYTAWRERVQQEGKVNGYSENQKAEMYMEQQKGRNGFVKFLDNVSSNLLAGSHDLVAGIAGTAGLLTGSQVISDYAAEKAGEANRTTAALQHTGNDGTLSSIVGGLARAAPGLAATAATGGAAGAAVVAFTQGAGSTYADLYDHHTQQGLSAPEAHKAAFGASAASGAFSAALGRIFPGGANALNNPAAREAARKSFGSVVKSFIKGGADELPQEPVDSGFNHYAAEINKGRSVKEATASFVEQFPELAATAVGMGGVVQAGADLRGGNKGGGSSNAHVNLSPGSAPAGTAVPAARDQQQGQADTAGSSSSSSSSSGSSGSPPAEGTNTRPSAPAQDGQQTTHGQAPALPDPVIRQTAAAPGSSGQQPAAPAISSGQPPSAPRSPAPGKPSRPPLSVEHSRKLIENVSNMPPGPQGHPTVQADLEQARRVVAEDTARALERKAQDHGGQLDAEDTQALANARAELGNAGTHATRSTSGRQPPGASATTNGVNPPAGIRAGESAPARGGSGQPAQAPARSTIPQATTHPTSPGRLSRPPLSVEHSRKLIANVAKMPPQARQHPTVQADLAQAQRVVAQDAAQILEQSGAADGTTRARARVGKDPAALQPERSSRYNSGTGQPLRSLADRSMENKPLRATRPQRKHAPSTHMEVQSWGPHGEAMTKAIILIDHAHDDGTLGRLTLNARDVPHSGDGVYRHAHFPYPARIGVRQDCTYPIFTTLHEIGHHARTAMPPQEVAELAEAARRTKGSQMCLARNDDAKYWLSDSELFSRVYAQWIAERVQHIDNEAFIELELIKESFDHWQQFEGNESTEISKQMTLLMKKKGWL